MNQIPPTPPGVPAAVPKERTKGRSVAIGVALVLVTCVGAFFALAVILRSDRRGSSVAARSAPPESVAWSVSESAVATALNAGADGWQAAADGSRMLNATVAGVVASIVPTDDRSGTLALAVTIEARESLLERSAQAERAADALRVAAPEWLGARGFVRRLAFGERPVDQHISGYVIVPSASVGDDGGLLVTVAIGREEGSGRPGWMDPSTWDATVWAQHASSASEWADDACLLASRCVFADPFTWHGERLHFPPSEFASCEATFGELCRQAVAEAEAIRAPAPLESSWTRMLQGHRQTIRDLERIRVLLDQYPRVELRPDGEGFEDYSAWLARRDRAASDAWFNETMASSDTARAGRTEFREWFAERMCFPRGPARGDQVFAATRQRLPEWRVPLRVGDPACPGSR